MLTDWQGILTCKNLKGKEE